MFVKIATIDAPSERKLFFSLPDYSYRVRFEIDAPYLKNAFVLVTALAQTSHPRVWAWRGNVRVDSEHIADFDAWGLFNLNDRRGVVFVEVPESPREIRDEILASSVLDHGLAPVEYELPEGVIVDHLTKGPDEERLERCKEMRNWGEEPWGSFHTKTGPKLSVRYRKLEKVHHAWFFSGEVPKGTGQGFYSIKGMWCPETSEGSIIDYRDDYPFRTLDRVKTLTT